VDVLHTNEILQKEQSDVAVAATASYDITYTSIILITLGDIPVEFPGRLSVKDEGVFFAALS